MKSRLAWRPSSADLRKDTPRQPRSGLARFALWATLLLSSPVALAQSAEDLARQDAQRLQQLEQQRRDEQFLKDRSSAAPPTRLPVPDVPEPVRRPGACRNVTDIQVSGATLLDADEIEALVARYRNTCLGVTEIEALLSDITRAYVSKGWIAVRAYLPQQDLSTGKLQIVVIEGKVSAIEVDDGDEHSITVGNVAPFVEGSPLNLRDFEQALDQINRLASNNATIDLRPGEQPGDTVVILHNQPGKPWHISLGADNHGSESTGRDQGTVSLSFDNPLRLNDFISYTRRQSIPAREDRKLNISDSASYILPFGYTTLSLNASQSRYDSQTATASGAIFHSNGTSENRTVRLDHVLARDATTHWNAYSSLTTKDTEVFLEGIRLDAASRKLTVLDVGVSVNAVIWGGALSLDVGHSRGLRLFGAMQDADGLTKSDPRAQFRKWTLNGSYIRPFEVAGQALQFSSQWSAQYAENVLYGSEQMLIGGIYTVRGFDRSTLSGDHGFFIRNEIGLRQPFEFAGMPGSVRPWIGLDYGLSRSRNAGVPEGALVGAALGVQANFKNGISLDVFAAGPLRTPAALEREGTAVWARLGIAI